MVTVRSRLGLQHQSGLCERRIRGLLRILQNLLLGGDLGHRSATQECNAGKAFEGCSHVLECRADNEEGSVQQFPTQRRIYNKDHLIRVGEPVWPSGKALG